MRHDDSLDISGTSFHGVTFVASQSDLTKAIGAPCTYREGKVRCEWRCKTPSGKVFAIYDWKHPRFTPTEMVRWHIGARSEDVALEAAKALAQVMPA